MALVSASCTWNLEPLADSHSLSDWLGPDSCGWRREYDYSMKLE